MTDGPGQQPPQEPRTNADAAGGGEREVLEGRVIPSRPQSQRDADPRQDFRRQSPEPGPAWSPQAEAAAQSVPQPESGLPWSPQDPRPPALNQPAQEPSTQIIPTQPYPAQTPPAQGYAPQPGPAPQADPQPYPAQTPPAQGYAPPQQPAAPPQGQQPHAPAPGPYAAQPGPQQAYSAGPAQGQAPQQYAAQPGQGQPQAHAPGPAPQPDPQPYPAQTPPAQGHAPQPQPQPQPQPPAGPSQGRPPQAHAPGPAQGQAPQQPQGAVGQGQPGGQQATGRPQGAGSGRPQAADGHVPFGGGAVPRPAPRAQTPEPEGSTPDWGALAERQEATGARRRRVLMLTGGIVAVAVIAGGVATAVVMSGKSDDKPVAGPSSSATTSTHQPTLPPLPTFSSVAPPPPANPLDYLNTAAKDKAPLTPDSLFPGKQFVWEGRTYVKTKADVTTSCAKNARQGVATALTANGCQKLIRATFTQGGLAVTVGVAVFPDNTRAKKVAGVSQYIAPLNGAGVADFCHAVRCQMTSNAVGRYAYFAISGFKNGKTLAANDTVGKQAANDASDFAFTRIVQRGKDAAAADPSRQQ